MLFIFAVMISAIACGQPLRISEIMADNGGILLDDDGDSADWIELHNTSGSPIDLDGWYLTDNDSELIQWSFPETNIAAKGFLVVFASDKDRSTAGSELHTNFKLSASGEYLALVQANGTTVEHELPFPALEEDISYGYAFTNGIIDISGLGQLISPTPGLPNTGINYIGNAEPPVTTPKRGFYDSAFQATVSNVTDGATIYYTLDGSEPTTNSALYTGPITISSTTNLRVRAFKDGWKPSYPRTDTYIFVNEDVTVPRSTTYINDQIIIVGMDTGVVAKTYHDSSNQVVTVQDALKAIPAISITTSDANLYDPTTGIYVNATERWERPASVELINPDGSEGFHVNAGLRIRGGWSRHPNFAKHSFRLFFRGEYGAAKLDYPLFEDEGVKSFDNLDLRTAQNYSWINGNDVQKLKNSFVRDVMCRDAAGAMGDVYPRSRYYQLYLNGIYWGLFMTEERPEASFAESYFGGDRDDYDTIKSTSWTDPLPRHIEATDGDTNAYTRLFNAAMAGFTNNADYFAVQGLNASGQPDPTKERLLDLENMIDYQLLIYYAGASDNGLTWFGGNRQVNNLFAVYNRSNPDGFKWIQHDCEHAFDTSTDLDRTGPFTDSNFTLPQFFNAQTLHEKLSVNAEYRIAFADRVYKHFKNNGALTAAKMEALLNFRSAQIDRAIVANAARWGSTRFDRDTWAAAIEDVRAFLPGRGDIVIGYLVDDGLIPSIEPPKIIHPGGPVDDGTMIALNASEGTIYYTTDGTDPRAIGGTIAGSLYNSPIAIHEPVKIKARALKANGDWSALAEGTFWTPEIPLAITELMYHAPDGNLHDFIEIKNVSTQSVHLAGYKLDNAIGFKFRDGMQIQLAPNGYIVVVDNIDAFSSTYYTNGILIAGEYSGNLGNSGETVDLEFHGNDLVSFTYSDARNWPQAADGAGHSLVPLAAAMETQESGSLDYGGNWRASQYINGSPGRADPITESIVVLNEITAHTDTGLAPPFDSNDRIELFNPTASPVTLYGWYLSDSLDDLNKWAIPNGTVVPAFGFTEFDEYDFHPGRIDGFGLDKNGEQVILSTPGRVRDAIRFKGQANGVSFGRYPDGASDWVITMPTPGSANQPAATTLQISELMYHPLLPSGDEMEYIQLENTGTSTAQFENLTGTYRIDGGVSYTFPAGISLAAGDKLWLVSFDPVIDTELLSQFRTIYGLSGSDPVYGPFQGKLSNRGERVALERPQASDDPLNPLDISWVVLDELFYFDQAPWPTSADGGGHPLIRTGLSSWTVPFTPGIAVSETTIHKLAFTGETPVESSFQVWNSALSTLDYSITTDVPWLSASPPSGSSTGEKDNVTLNYDATGLTAGTYTGQLAIAAIGAFNTPRPVPVILEIYEQTLDHFSWESIGTDQSANQPFSVSVSARDQHDALFSPFTDSISVSGLIGGLPPPEINLGTGLSQWDYPLSTSSHDARTQSIYLNTEIGYACSITSLAFNVSILPGQMLGNWTIRMRHTPLSSYDTAPVWESTWTTVYQHDTTISSTGWTVFELDVPFDYNGTDNLMIDFSFNNASRTERGYCASTSASTRRSLYYRVNSNYGDPLNWTGSFNPTPNRSTRVPDIRLGCLIDNSVSISPTATGNFVNGNWSGMVIVHEGVSNVLLHANGGGSHSGFSIPFNVAATDADDDGIPDAWETSFFGLPSNCQATNDADHDGHSNLQEYIAGMDPTNASSRFTVELTGPLPEGFVVRWNPVEERIYDVLWTPSLEQTFQILEPAILYPVNSYTDTVHGTASSGFYIVVVRMRGQGDIDGDGLPDGWESDYFTGPTAAAAGHDFDDDGQSNIEEYLAGTNPTNAASKFMIDAMSAPAVYWTEKSGRNYSVYWTDDLRKPFSRIADGLTTGNYTDHLHTNSAPNFYRIMVEME